MSIEITAGYIAAAAADESLSLKKARFCYQTYSYDATVTASTTETGFYAAALNNPLTYQFWKPTALPANFYFDAGSAVDVDYFALAAHTLGSSGATITLAHSTDAATWTDVDAATPTDDSPILFLFESISRRYWRISITGSTIPVISVAYFGESLIMERTIYQGYTPINYSQTTDIRPNMSETGQFLGRSIIRKGFSGSAKWSNLTPTFIDTDFKPFIVAAKSYPYFFAWRPLDKADGIGYVWTNDDINPENSGPRDLMSVSVSMEGLSVE